MLSICQRCGKPGVAGSFINCGCPRPKSKHFTIQGERRVVVPRHRILNMSDRIDCIHRGNQVGEAACGCAGKPKVYWCDLLKGHCTLHSTGNSWTKTTEGVSRVGKLKPCIVCEDRTCKAPKKLLNKTIPPWHYITGAELVNDVTDMLGKFPPIRGVAGIPVSGHLAAPWIATMLHVPLYEASDQNGLVASGHGGRGGTRHVDESLPLLVIDDTVSNGGSMQRIKDKLGPGNYIFATVYCKPGSEHHVDYFGTYLQEPHLLEWNLANTGYIPWLSPNAPEETFAGAGVATDLDGVYCPDPPREFNERDVADRQAYLDWISNAPLLRFVPRMYEVPLIVSYRCEYARSATEAWLARHGIKYKELRLWPDSVGARTFDGSWKAKAYAERNFGLFIESNHQQAKAIAAATGKRVLCTDTRMVY